MWKTALALIVLLILQVRSSPAQDFLRLSNEQRIQLQIDRIRKGIQQQDTVRLGHALSPQVVVGDKGWQSKNTLLQNFQSLFDNKSERQFYLPRPDFPRTDSRLIQSDYWDFDILYPKVTIRGDSAFVQCELILWAGPTNQPESGRGFRRSETFVFYSSSDQSEEAPNSPDMYEFSTKAKSSRRSWQIVGTMSLIDFMEATNKPQTDAKGEGAAVSETK